MKTQLNKQQFIDLLSSQLSENDSKQMLISEAKKLIPSETDRRQLTALHNSRHLQKAFRAYMQLHPGADKPNIEILVEWLLEMGSINYAMSLEKKLTWINKFVMGYGLISPEDTFTLSGDEMISLRSHSNIDLVLTKPD